MNTGRSSLWLNHLGVVMLVLTATLTGLAEERRAIKLPGTAGLPFSDGVIAGDTLYVAGQEGIDEKGKLVAGGIGPETQAALANIEKIVQAAGFELKDIV